MTLRELFWLLFVRIQYLPGDDDRLRGVIEWNTKPKKPSSARRKRRPNSPFTKLAQRASFIALFVIALTRSTASPRKWPQRVVRRSV